MFWLDTMLATEDIVAKSIDIDVESIYKSTWNFSVKSTSSKEVGDVSFHCIDYIDKVLQ